jgi:hypothetical protein
MNGPPERASKLSDQNLMVDDGTYEWASHPETRSMSSDLALINATALDG